MLIIQATYILQETTITDKYLDGDVPPRLVLLDLGQPRLSLLGLKERLEHLLEGGAIVLAARAAPLACTGLAVSY